MRAFFFGESTMKVFLVLTALFTTQALGQDSLKAVVSVFYFGGSDCPYCMDSSNVKNIVGEKQIGTWIQKGYLIKN